MSNRVSERESDRVTKNLVALEASLIILVNALLQAGTDKVVIFPQNLGSRKFDELAVKFEHFLRYVSIECIIRIHTFHYLNRKHSCKSFLIKDDKYYN